MDVASREPPSLFEDDEGNNSTAVDNPLDKAKIQSSLTNGKDSDVNDDKEEDIFAEANEELSPGDGVKLESTGDKASPSNNVKNELSDINNSPRPDADPLSLLSIQSSRGYAGSAPAVSSATRPSDFGSKQISIASPAQASAYDEGRTTICIAVKDPKKVGDGMTAYMVYKVITKTNIPDFRHTEAEVYRRFSDFLGLHEKLVEKHLHLGRIIPPPPEKSVIGMTKIKMKEEASSAEFIEQRRAALERFINAVAKHPSLQTDPSLVDFLEVEGDLPRSTSTSALSSTSVMKLFSRVGDSLGKITYKMDESDQSRSEIEWFEEKQKHIENLDVQLRKLHSSFEMLVLNRRELAQATGVFANSAEMLGAVEEHQSLSCALSQLGSVEEKIDALHVKQADCDFYVFSELIKDYIGMVQAIKDVFHERVKVYKAWKDEEAMLVKKREAKARLELAHKTDKVPAASQEICEYEHRVEKSSEEFENISKNIRKELERFENQRCTDMREAIVTYLETLMRHQQQVISHWESFLPEAKAIA